MDDLIILLLLVGIVFLFLGIACEITDFTAERLAEDEEEYGSPDEY